MMMIRSCSAGLQSQESFLISPNLILETNKHETS